MNKFLQSLYLHKVISQKNFYLVPVLFFIYLMFWSVISKFTIGSLKGIGEFNPNLLSTIRTRKMIKFGFRKKLFSFFKSNFKFCFIILILNNFWIFSNICNTLLLILKWQRFWWITFS